MNINEKLEIINKQLDGLYEDLNDLENFTTDAQNNITQAIYNLERIKVLLEQSELKPISLELDPNLMNVAVYNHECDCGNIVSYTDLDINEEEGVVDIDCPKCGAKIRLVCEF